MVGCLVISLYLGDGVGGLRMQGLHLSCPKGLSGSPPPPAAYVYNVQSVPPCPQKTAPPARKMAGGAERGDGSVLLSKARIQIKKNIIIIIII